MYKYHKTYHKSSHICECENRSLLLKGRRRGQKNVPTELDWASPRQSSETAGLEAGATPGRCVRGSGCFAREQEQFSQRRRVRGSLCGRARLRRGATPCQRPG